jgi:hypothetical protein
MAPATVARSLARRADGLKLVALQSVARSLRRSAQAAIAAARMQRAMERASASATRVQTSTAVLAALPPPVGVGHAEAEETLQAALAVTPKSPLTMLKSYDTSTEKYEDKTEDSKVGPPPPLMATNRSFPLPESAGGGPFAPNLNPNPNKQSLQGGSAPAGGAGEGEGEGAPTGTGVTPTGGLSKWSASEQAVQDQVIYDAYTKAWQQ